jgi:broad specificity polyphosphatase/5'/3'-nucleotidase SurE
MPDALTFDQQLDLQQHQDLGQYTFSLQGATPADCVLCAVDQTCGLAKSLSLAPVMVLVGVARAPALSSGERIQP